MATYIDNFRAPNAAKLEKRAKWSFLRHDLDCSDDVAAHVTLPLYDQSI